ncbi:electron transfer flavoprotein subunit alpha [mine drainage metagenome]|uniref:Electron transfer flavoprotein subunit alpha n=1 Tax=mine drainage metagenome TaxID=410659 RepID=A0A1J5Q369_9ZZZZ
MNVSSQAWVVVPDDASIGGLLEAARPLGTPLVALVVGRREVADAVAASGVDRVVWLGAPGDGTPLEAYAPAVGRVVAQASPRVVIGPSTDAGRALLGAVAAVTQAVVLAGVTQLALDGDQVVVERAVNGGFAVRRDRVVAGPAVVALAPGDAVVAGTPVPVEEVDPGALLPLRVIARRVTVRAGVDLGSAKTVVGVGRGLKAREDLALIEDLAAAAGGELACSRPLAEGVDWVGKERYLGISGQTISPDLYVAVGISGQIQHMVGVREAKTIVAVNSDPKAPIFRECDFGIVGDLYTVVPLLAEAFRAARS